MSIKIDDPRKRRGGVSLKNVIEDFTESNYWKFLGLELEQFEKGAVKLKLPITPSFHNVQHMVHGGVYASLLDTTMGITLRSFDYSIVTTLNMDIHFLKPAKKGALYCVGHIIHQGKSTSLVKAELYNEKNELLSYASGTFRSQK